MQVAFRLASLLGAIGTLLCLAGTMGVWYVESRIDRAREHLFDRVDRSLSGIDGRLVEAQKLAVEAKITVEEVEQRVQSLTKEIASDRVVASLNLGARVQRLVVGLRQAESTLELSYESVQQLRQLLEFGAEFGFALDADSMDVLLERISDVNNELSSAIERAESLGNRIGEDSAGEPPGERMKQIATTTARLLATFGKLDSRLASIRGRLDDARNSTETLSSKTHARIVAAAVCVTLLLLWMAAGQLCLWRWGRIS